jgi:phage gp36-like protein
MPYATQADLVARFGTEELVQLTDRTGADTVEAGVVDAALADAAAKIHGYLAARYALPVSPAPDLLRSMQADVARYLLHGDRATELVRKNYEDALKLLRDLSEGKAVLAGASPAGAGASPAAAAGQVRVAAPGRRFGAEGGIGEYLG